MSRFGRRIGRRPHHKNTLRRMIKTLHALEGEGVTDAFDPPAPYKRLENGDLVTTDVATGMDYVYAKDVLDLWYYNATTPPRQRRVRG